MTIGLDHLLVAELYGVLFIFARLGAALMVLPGFGEPYVLGRFRLWLGLILSLILAGSGAIPIPKPALLAGELLVQIGGEIIVGLMIGAIVRLTLTALHFAGSFIAMQSGLAAAAFFDPQEATQSSLTGNFLVTLFLVVLFVTDGHHLILLALAASYGPIAPATLPVGGLVETLVRTGAGALDTGLRVAAPLLVTGFLTFVLIGVLNRLMPTLQVLFVIMPLQIAIGLFVVGLSLHSTIEVVAQFFRTSLVFWQNG